MDEMREIITVEQANGLFLILAIAAPIVGATGGAILGWRRSQLQSLALRGFLFGLAGPLNLVLWKIYNRITDHFGLDTVKNLLINLALFAALGMTAGIIAGRYYRRKTPLPATGPEAEGSTAIEPPEEAGEIPPA